MTDVRAYEPGADPDDVPRPGDAESYVEEPQVTVRVESRAEKPTVHATVTRLSDGERPPLIPSWVKNAQERKAVFAQAWGLFWYTVARQALKSPKYLIKTAFYAPWGVFRLVGRQVRWMWHPELTELEQAAARKTDLDRGPLIARQVGEKRKARVWVLTGEALVLTAAGGALWFLAPAWALWLTAVVLVPVLARFGRPADKPIIEHITLGRRFTRLTAEMVRDAVVALRLTGIKGPGDITFPPPGIHTDGPGWLARFELPPGLIASDVLEKRDRLSGAMRLPIDQVWPEVGPDHLAQVDLWVGFQPASKMGDPPWALARPDALTSVFDPHPFATDARRRPINISLFEINILMGGQPGAGKSYGARTFATIAGLDPTCELMIAEFKGVGDFLDMSELCTQYACGVDDEAFDIGEAIIDWLLAECERRGARIKKLRLTGEAPEGKITPELAARKGSGLHPIFVLIDEFHELLLNRKGVAEKAERVLRRGRALGIILVLATQIPDAKTIPSGITKCVSVRVCMSVADQVANDQILGTGAYKRGHSATMYRPKFDAGWGVMQGLERDGQTGKTYFPDPQTQAAIVERMRQLRGGSVVGQREERVKARNMLADVRQVIRQGEAGVPWDVLAERLAVLVPEVYEGVTGDMVREAMKRYDVFTESVKWKVDGEWRSLKGMRRVSLEQAETKHALED
ncbi:FtsK/SpoIIIE domain-containing protein [Actinoplanes sichuanensis]|uniref:FtsK/SpoIIIE domain-containing protein n=1 Tax=Actinoplanes sichuanensis TaxID=512349 RepID=A0ABW4A7T7_9ACTN|nr:FtsK/SpoIIIE domain-containing protein [Actinoplanes sichuanensis]BEL07801.1 FtsK/SpoIIIE domain-containing protein [Actinoplanes sichuanensis]